jgi:hypothetical protein
MKRMIANQVNKLREEREERKVTIALVSSGVLTALVSIVWLGATTTMTTVATNEDPSVSLTTLQDDIATFQNRVTEQSRRAGAATALMSATSTEDVLLVDLETTASSTEVIESEQ